MDDSYLPANMAGKPDGREWTNDNLDMGFDPVEATFDKPVHAIEVRVVFSKGQDQSASDRLPRHWFVREFAATTTPIQAVKVTIANCVERGYKAADAVQLIGE